MLPSCKQDRFLSGKDRTMAYVMQLRAPGGVDQLEAAEVVVPAPGTGEILVRQTDLSMGRH
jgi:hypothetical protein